MKVLWVWWWLVSLRRFGFWLIAIFGSFSTIFEVIFITVGSSATVGLFEGRFAILQSEGLSFSSFYIVIYFEF